jgi:predicted ferric reductase
VLWKVPRKAQEEDRPVVRCVIKECLAYEGFRTLYVLNYVIYNAFYFHGLLFSSNYVLYETLCILTIFEVFVNFSYIWKFSLSIVKFVSPRSKSYDMNVYMSNFYIS